MSGGAKAALVGLAATVAVPLALIVLVIGTSGACSGDASAQPPTSKAAEGDVPSNYLNLYKQAGQRFGVPWPVLAGVGKTETDHGRSTAPGVHSGQNYAGAGGPMQFLAATWDQYGVDGNDDGDRDRYDPQDAIPGAAHYLKTTGADGNANQIRRALFAYNHSTDYVNTVLGWADRYQSGQFTVASANTTGVDCTELPSGPFGNRVLQAARRHLGVPYSWGGGTPSGPSTGTCCSPSGGDGRKVTGFDCSGLVLYAIHQASNGKINLPHSADIQARRGTAVPPSQMQPGDIIAFASRGSTYYTHIGIYAGQGKLLQAPSTGDVVKLSPLSHFANRSWSIRRYG